MPLYYYKAATKSGRIVKNRVEDMSRLSLLKKLKRNGLIPIAVMQTAKRKNTARRPKKNSSGMAEIVKNANINARLENRQAKLTLKEKVYGKLALTEKVTMRDIIIFTQNFYLLKKANFNNIHALSTVIENTDNLTLKEILEDVLANIEVNIDYPEYEDIKKLTNEDILPNLKKIRKKMEDILKESRNGIMIQQGIKTSIVGRPNVGKSSLLNALLEENKAIVTDIEGTTRDIVEGEILVCGVPFHIIDTAGIRKSDHLVEQIGIQKSLELIDQSELVLFVLNNNEPLTEDDRKIWNKLKDKNKIVIINKTDLPTKLKLDQIPKEECVWISAEHKEGIDLVKAKMKEIFSLEKIQTEDPTYLTNANSISSLKNAITSIDQAITGIYQNMPIDMVEIDIKNAWDELGLIIGKTYQDELINQLFSQFCLGK